MRKSIHIFIIITFIWTSLLLPSVPVANSQDLFETLLPPGTMVGPSSDFVPVLLTGMSLRPDDPLRFNFFVDSGYNELNVEQIKDESQKLVRYFMSALTIPKDDLWVNLSPYESDRIITPALGQTELGQDLLAQDYLLKQLTSSLIYPENDLGNQFWQRVYEKAYDHYGVTELPINTFNKVWVLPEEAKIYEAGLSAYIVKARLKIMLDQDYLALKNNQTNESLGLRERPQGEVEDISSLSSSIVRQLIIPEIEKEVNEGENFAPLRQIYHALILAKWYKETITNSLLSQGAVDQNNILGVDVDDPEIKDKIYETYLRAFHVGVFDYIKEEYDQFSQQVIPRKYFSGGITRLMNVNLERTDDAMLLGQPVGRRFLLETGAFPRQAGDRAMLSKDLHPLTKLTEVALLDKLFEEVRRENRWKKDAVLNLADVAEAIQGKLVEMKANVDIKDIEDYLINTPGYPISGNVHLATVTTKLEGKSNGLDSLGIGRATFFEREDVSYTYPFVAPVDSEDIRQRKIEHEKKHVVSTFEKVFEQVTPLKGHPQFAEVISRIEEFITEGIENRMEFAYRLVHELIRMNNEDIRETLDFDESFIDDAFLDELKLELQNEYIPRLVSERSHFFDSNALFGRSQPLLERFKIFRSTWATLLTHPFALEKVQEFRDLVTVFNRAKDLFDSELAKPVDQRDNNLVARTRNEMERINKRLRILNQEIGEDQNIAGSQRTFFFDEFLGKPLRQIESSGADLKAHEIVRLAEQNMNQFFDMMRSSGAWSRNIEAIAENFTAFGFVQGRLDSQSYVTSFLDPVDVQEQKKSIETGRLASALAKTRTLFVLELLRKEAKAEGVTIHQDYVLITRNPDTEQTIVKTLIERDANLKAFIEGLESFLRQRILSRGVNLESALADFMAIYYDDVLFQEIDGMMGVPRFEDRKEKIDFENMIFNFAMLFSKVLGLESTKRVQEPMVIFIDPAIDVLTPNEVGALNQRFGNIVAFVEKGRSPHAINQFPLSVSGVSRINEANVNEGDIVIVQGSSKGLGEISIRPNVFTRLQAYRTMEDLDRKQEYYFSAAARAITVGGKPYNNLVSIGANMSKDIEQGMGRVAAAGVGLHRLELMFGDPYNAGVWNNENTLINRFSSIMNAQIFSDIKQDNVLGLYVPRLDDVGGEKMPPILEKYLDNLEQAEGREKREQVRKTIMQDYSGMAFYFYTDDKGERPFYEYGQRQLRALFKAFHKADNKRLGITFPNVKKIEGVMTIDDILNMITEARAKSVEDLFIEEEKDRQVRINDIRREIHEIESLSEAPEADRLRIERLIIELAQQEDELAYFVQDKEQYTQRLQREFDEVKIGFYVEEVDQLVHYEEMVRKSDFTAIGTNDMLKSLFKRDFPDISRFDSRYSHLFDEPQPRLFEVTWFMTKVSKRHGKPFIISGDWGDSVRWAGMIGTTLALKYDAQVLSASSVYKTARLRAYMQFLDTRTLFNPEAAAQSEWGIFDEVLRDLENVYQNDFSKGFIGELRDREGFIERINALQEELDRVIDAEVLKIEQEGGLPQPEGQDNAMLETEKNVGGIDLNEIDLQRLGTLGEIEFDQERVQEILDSGPIDGFSPVIINVIPVNNILPLIRLEDQGPVPEESLPRISRLNQSP